MLLESGLSVNQLCQLVCRSGNLERSFGAARFALALAQRIIHVAPIRSGVHSTEIYLDPSSLLPLGVTFTIHPYDPANPNRPIMPYRDETLDGIEQASFSDYRQVQGRPVAFHIHSAMNAGATRIVTDIQFSSISFNTGATIAAN